MSRTKAAPRPVDADGTKALCEKLTGLERESAEVRRDLRNASLAARLEADRLARELAETKAQLATTAIRAEGAEADLEAVVLELQALVRAGGLFFGLFTKSKQIDLQAIEDAFSAAATAAEPYFAKLAAADAATHTPDTPDLESDIAGAIEEAREPSLEDAFPRDDGEPIPRFLASGQAEPPIEEPRPAIAPAGTKVITRIMDHLRRPSAQPPAQPQPTTGAA